MNSVSATLRHRLLAWARLAALLPLLLAPLPARAQDAPAPDLPTYTAWVREAATAARRGDRLGLEDAAARLTATRVVRVGADELPVDNAWLAEELAGPAPRTALIAARLAAIADALSLPPGEAPQDALARLDALMARPPFAEPEELRAPQWWTDFWSWLGRLLESLLRRMPTPAPAQADGGSLWVAALGVTLVAGVLLYLTISLRRSVLRGAQASSGDPEDALTARDAFDQAGELARGGDSRTAVRYLYLAALLWLDERRLLRYDRALTNREYLERARANPELLRRLQPIVSTFDRVWYGHATLSAEELGEYTRQVERLRAEL